MEKADFYKFILPLKENLFNKLSDSIDFEDIGKGRKGNVLVGHFEEGVPIVRTTTKYTKPAHYFSTSHNMIVENILEIVPNIDAYQFQSLSFNNALIEIYDHAYSKMGYHSDQCLDLAADSFIALFSCYEQPDDVSEQALRKLRVKNKETAEEFEFSLENNSVILFSLPTNTKFLHKIILEQAQVKKPIALDNRWLGMTFRKSKTFIRFRNNLPCFYTGELLALADETQIMEFYRLRGAENNSMNFIYPNIEYTLSISDTFLPIG